MTEGLHVIEPDADALNANLASEQATLGWLIQGPPSEAVSEVWSLLSPSDFYRPGHQVLARVCNRLFLDGEPVDPVRVWQEVVKADAMRTIGGSATYLQTLMHHSATGAGNAAWHVKRIVEAARGRDAVVLATQTLQRLAQPGADLLQTLTVLEEELMGLKLAASVSIDLGTVDFLDFLSESDADVDFVIPGLLGRREKAMFTGGEGLGKSTLLRQLALATAAGMHPFTKDFIEPRRVLWLDAENHEDTSRRLFRFIYEHGVVRRGRSVRPGMLTLKHLQQFDLLNDRDVSWLARVVTDCRPDLIYIGPLYQVVGGSLNDEDVGQKVVRTLNRLCNLHGSAMILEAHAGHGKGHGGQREWRPRGSSVLLGWPDFGFGLGLSDDPGAEVNRLVDVHRWRGERHTGREWPTSLSRGGAWPFDAW